MPSKKPYIVTFTGRKFNPLDPRPGDVDIRDIAHALALQCRFAGHTRRFYSTAQHSWHVSHLVSLRDAYWGLLHDASEAYLVDVPRPVKHQPSMAAYRKAETACQEAICTRYGLPIAEPASVKAADDTMLMTERRDLMSKVDEDYYWPDCEPDPGIDLRAPWSPDFAEHMFLTRFHQLVGIQHG